jgi:hypothetical protein
MFLNLKTTTLKKLAMQAPKMKEKIAKKMWFVLNAC